jgi:intracellular sulfur oxidation DsrE/DsrF family protein
MLRAFVAILLTFMVLGPSSALAAEENSNEIKVVYDLKTGDLKTLERTLVSGVMKNSVHYQNQLKELEVIVVIHGESYRFFQKNNKMKDLGKKLKGLHESYGVEFEICKVGMKKRGIAAESLYPFVNVVPNASLALIDAQHEGYAYLPVH